MTSEIKQCIEQIGITGLTAVQLSRAIRQRCLSCVDVMQAFLERIDVMNPTVNAIVSRRNSEDCLRDAHDADQALAAGQYRGWMHGMPQAVKDLSNVAGFPTRHGTPLSSAEPVARDDPHVAWMREAGALFIGKTNVPEWGLGSQTYNALFGTTRNAWNSEWTAGGSSGGAACALALHMLPVADGTDMMGSLRNPAAFNHVIGLRPSRGFVVQSATTDSLAAMLSTPGPMGRTAEDVYCLLMTLTGAMRDGASVPPVPLEADALEGTRIGWLGDLDGYLLMEEGVLALCEQTLEMIAAHGAETETVLPRYPMDRLWRSWLTLRQWTHRADAHWYEDPAKRSLMKPEWRWEIEGGLALAQEELAAAHSIRQDWEDVLDDLFRRHDVLALPAAQVFPFDAGVQWPQAINGAPMDSYHRWMEVAVPASLGGLPSVSVPVGADVRGRPMGLQFMGRPGQDRKLLEFARDYQSRISLAPPAVLSSLPADEVSGSC